MTTPTPDQCPGTAAPQQLVTPPTVTKFRYGAMSAFTVIDETDPHARNGVMYRSTPACSTVLTFDDVCLPDVPDPKQPTDFENSDVIVGCPFTIYAYLSCRQTSLEQMLVDARLALDLNEQFGVEGNVWFRTVATTAANVVNASSDPSDAMSIVAGVAALESRINECYAGVATLHADRGIAIFAAAEYLVEKQGGAAFTPLGSHWAFYAGSPNTGPDGTPAPDGYTWIYATSQIVLRRFEALVPDSVDHILRYPTNEPVVIAERTYVATRECCAFAVLVSLVD